jgi:cyclophilin family peptidyl-prolyl cis-trans isomerase
MTDSRRRGPGGRPGGGATDGPIPAFDLYAVVGVRPEATHQEIVEAIAALDQRLRTAAARDRPGATARLKRLNVARHWLTDGARRRAYDAAVAGGAAGAAGRVRGGRVGAGSATRGSGSSWLSRPLTWAGIAAVALIAAFLVLRPGGLGGGASGPSASGSASVAGGSSASGAAAGSSASAVAGASGCPTSQPPPLGAGQKRLVTLTTAKGPIGITIEADLSPIAAGNFVALASCGFYDGVVFHRVATLQDGTPFVIQGGDPTGTGTGGPGYEIQDEPVKTPYKRGTVAMARTSAPNSVGSQFFIVLDDKDAPVLSSANTYQIIGSVTSGMEAVDAIYAAAGGQENPASPIAMDDVTVTTP